MSPTWARGRESALWPAVSDSHQAESIPEQGSNADLRFLTALERAERDRAQRIIDGGDSDSVWARAARAYLDGKYDHICVPYELGGSCTSPHPSKEK